MLIFRPLSTSKKRTKKHTPPSTDIPMAETLADTPLLAMLNASMNKRKHSYKRNSERNLEPAPKWPDKAWLFGIHAVLAAVANPKRKITRLVISEPAWQVLEKSLVGAEKAAGRSLRSPDIIDRREIGQLLPPGAVHQGIAAQVAPLAGTTMDQICADSTDLDDALVVILDRVTDPHNVGAVSRSCAAFGAIALIIQHRHAPETTGTMAKSASGALETVPIARVANLTNAMRQLKKSGFWCTGLDLSAKQTVAKSATPTKTALVLGSEGEGMRRLIRETCDLLVRIPTSAAQI